MNEDLEYKKKLLMDKLETYRDLNKLSYNSTKNLQNIIESSNTIPISAIYSVLTHQEQEKNQVIDQINHIISSLIPKKDTTKQENDTKESTENTEPKKQEQKTNSEETKESNEKEVEPKKKHSFEIDDNIDDDDFDLEE